MRRTGSWWLAASSAWHRRIGGARAPLKCRHAHINQTQVLVTFRSGPENVLDTADMRFLCGHWRVACAWQQYASAHRRRIQRRRRPHTGPQPPIRRPSRNQRPAPAPEMSMNSNIQCMTGGTTLLQQACFERPASTLDTSSVWKPFCWTNGARCLPSTGSNNTFWDATAWLLLSDGAASDPSATDFPAVA